MSEKFTIYSILLLQILSGLSYKSTVNNMILVKSEYVVYEIRNDFVIGSNFLQFIRKNISNSEIIDERQTTTEYRSKANVRRYVLKGDKKLNTIKDKDTSIPNKEDRLTNTIYNLTDNVDSQDMEFRVIQGKPATTTSVPYQVGFFRNIDDFWEKYKAFCGGALISPTKIISAAHCFVKTSYFQCCKGSLSKSDFWKVRAVMGMILSNGSPQNPSYPQQWRRLKHGKYPENFKFPKEDICVVFTESPFNLNQYVTTISYNYHYAASNLTGKECVISGYGRIDETTLSNKLKYGHVTILSNAKCSSIHRKIMKNFLCTTDIFADPAKGDSGGPLNCENHVVGVVSGKKVYTRSGTFFTRLSVYNDLINGSVIVEFYQHFLLSSLLLIHMLSL